MNWPEHIEVEEHHTEKAMKNLVQIRDSFVCKWDKVMKHFRGEDVRPCHERDGVDGEGRPVSRVAAVYIKPLEEGGDCDPDNMVTLCKKHQLMWGRRRRTSGEGFEYRPVTVLEIILMMYGISQGDLAEALGVSRPLITRFFRHGVGAVRLDKAGTIVDFIKEKTGRDMTVEELFEEVEV